MSRSRLFRSPEIRIACDSVVPFFVSDTFTWNSGARTINGGNAFRNKELKAPIEAGHESCIGTPRKPATLFGKGSIRHHGLDLVDRLGVPYRRLRRHAARCVGRARAEGEGTRLASRNPCFDGATNDRERASPVPRASANRRREPLRSSFPMSKNEGFRPVGRGQLMADIAPPRNARLAAHSAAHSALLHGRDVP